jgi:hypothetical protein
VYEGRVVTNADDAAKRAFGDVTVTCTSTCNGGGTVDGCDADFAAVLVLPQEVVLVPRHPYTHLRRTLLLERLTRLRRMVATQVFAFSWV